MAGLFRRNMGPTAIFGDRMIGLLMPLIISGSQTDDSNTLLFEAIDSHLTLIMPTTDISHLSLAVARLWVCEHNTTWILNFLLIVIQACDDESSISLSVYRGSIKA
jgi:hypothetical protein